MSVNGNTEAVTKNATDTGTGPSNIRRPRMLPDPEPEQQQLQEQSLQKVMTSYTYLWSISGWKGPRCQIGEYIESPRFTVCDTNDANREYMCFLRFYGNGLDDDTKDYISIRFYLVDKIDDISVCNMNFQCKISILQEDNVESCSQHARITHLNFENKQNCIYTFRKFLYRFSDLICSPSTCLQKNCDLILLCCVGIAKYRKKIMFDGARYQFCMRISNQVASFHDWSFCSDLEIVAPGRRFLAHKCIIAKRSPALFSKLCLRLCPNIEKTIAIIEDIEADVLSRILQFIYKGTFNDSPDITEKLLVASKEYKIDALKDLCEVNLCDRVNVNNAIDLLLLAQKHHANILKETVIQFIVNHAAEIIESNGFKDLGISHHELVKEIFCQLALK